MKSVLLGICVLLSIGAYSQDFKKDPRSENLKEDNYDAYQVSQISKTDLLKALEIAGVRIFNCPIAPKFDQTYKLVINLDEYVNGKKISTKNISPNQHNTYSFYEGEKLYFDYINELKFIAKDTESDSTAFLNVEVHGNTTGINLKKNKERKYQYYQWRRFYKADWVLDKEIPVLVFASSWYDKKNSIERFCGTVDLSRDKNATDELLKNSPHYFIISYKTFR
ncbi:MAG: hypothetical protein JWR38_1885 [Mucilaginibacter sp.]|nr:hypothetical protein [Mucilaginibacter sp.]